MGRLLAVALLLSAACSRSTPPAPPSVQSVRIAVRVAWPEQFAAEPAHRLSLRFYPASGAPFERYLESNLDEGTVTVPQGAYTGVIALNESITDAVWWAGAVEFSGADRFDTFAAAATGTDLPLLASWSAADLRLTADTSFFVELRPLTCPVTLDVVLETASIATLSGELSGLPARVLLASGASAGTAAHASASSGRTLFFRTLQPAAPLSLNLEATLINGSTHRWPAVTLLATPAGDGLRLRAPASGSLDLPASSGPDSGVGITPWPEQTIDL